MALTLRKKSFIIVSLLLDPVGTEALLSVFPLAQQEDLKAGLNEIKQNTRNADPKSLALELKKVQALSKKSILSEIHPDWIMELLMKESPRLVATVLRYLSGEQVRYILEHLPESVMSSLPPLDQTFSIRSEVIDVLKSKFENYFDPFIERELPPNRDRFESLCLLSFHDLENLFKDLGFREMAMAFATLNEKAIEAILSRLPVEDAESLKAHIASRGDVVLDRLKRAQNNLLASEMKRSEYLILELGLYVYSKAIMPAQLDFAKRIVYKFPREVGKQLKKYLDRNMPHNQEMVAKRYQSETLDGLKRIQD